MLSNQLVSFSYEIVCQVNLFSDRRTYTQMKKG